MTAQQTARELRYQNDSGGSGEEFINGLTRFTDNENKGQKILRECASDVFSEWSENDPRPESVDGCILFAKRITESLCKYWYKDNESQEIIKNW